MGHKTSQCPKKNSRIATAMPPFMIEKTSAKKAYILSSEEENVEEEADEDINVMKGPVSCNEFFFV